MCNVFPLPSGKYESDAILCILTSGWLELSSIRLIGLHYQTRVICNKTKVCSRNLISLNSILMNSVVFPYETIYHSPQLPFTVRAHGKQVLNVTFMRRSTSLFLVLNGVNSLRLVLSSLQSHGWFTHRSPELLEGETSFH